MLAAQDFFLFFFGAAAVIRRFPRRCFDWGLRCARPGNQNRNWRRRGIDQCKERIETRRKERRADGSRAGAGEQSIKSDFLRNRSTLERTEQGDMGQMQSIDCGKLRALREAGSLDRQTTQAQPVKWVRPKDWKRQKAAAFAASAGWGKTARGSSPLRRPNDRRRIGRFQVHCR